MAEPAGVSAVTHDELLDEVQNLRNACASMMREMLLLMRPASGEPSPLAAQPILDAYATEAISGGRARELLRCWARGASREEIVALLPKDEVPHEN